MAKSESHKTKLKDGGIRKTFIINELLVLKAEKISEIEQRTIRNVVEEIFSHYIEVYEKQFGKLVIHDKKIKGGRILTDAAYELLGPTKPTKKQLAIVKKYLKKNSPKK